MPWLALRGHIAREWGIPPWEVGDPDLADEVGRWCEVKHLEQRYGG